MSSVLLLGLAIGTAGRVAPTGTPGATPTVAASGTQSLGKPHLRALYPLNQEEPLSQPLDWRTRVNAGVGQKP